MLLRWLAKKIDHSRNARASECGKLKNEACVHKKLVPAMSRTGNGGGAKVQMAKRHGKTRRDALDAVFTKPAIRRMSRRGGVIRVSDDARDMTRNLMKVVLQTLLREAVTYTEHSRRKTVNTDDLERALNRYKLSIYGIEKDSNKAKKTGKNEKKHKKKH